MKYTAVFRATDGEFLAQYDGLDKNHANAM